MPEQRSRIWISSWLHHGQGPLCGRPRMCIRTIQARLIDYFPEIYINPADTVGIPEFMPNYKGKVCFLEDGEILDLGGRILEIVFTPGHTPGSTTFVDKDAAYGFSGDSFGSGNLLLGVDFSTLISTCKKMSAVIEKYDIKYLYPGHYFGMNKETPQR